MGGETMIASKEMASKIHILAIPFPLQGHINPMLQFCKLLASRGIKITILTTAFTSKSIQTQTTSFNLETVPDVTDETEHRDVIDAFIKNFKLSISKSLHNIIEKMESLNFPVKVIAFDTIMPWVLDLAHQLGIKGAALSTQSCAVYSLFYHFQQGTLKLPLESEEDIISLPSLPPLGINDLPSSIYDIGLCPAVVEVLLSQNLNLGKVDWLLFNTFDELEKEVLNWMNNQWPIKTIGPTIPSKYLEKKSTDEDNDYGLSLFKQADDNAYIKWLDSKQPGSVVYISFGSLGNLEQQQMEEIFSALVNTNINFLWVVRASEQTKLPSKFMSELDQEKGLIVSWCSQLEVLAHRAVGFFMSHCGWNSTLEALSSGVVMVAMPIWSDQRTNAKFISGVWRVGVRVKRGENGYVKGEIERCLKDVMEGEKRMEFRENAIRLKKMVNEAINGGSSEKNIEQLIMELCALD